MVRNALPLLLALAVSLVAVGGVAADGTAIRTNDSDDDGQVGICVVGADSPCNDGSTGGDSVPPTHPTPQNDSDELGEGDSSDGQVWMPEDRNRDGEIDDRFPGTAFSDTVRLGDLHLPVVVPF